MPTHERPDDTSMKKSDEVDNGHLHEQQQKREIIETVSFYTTITTLLLTTTVLQVQQ